MTSKMKMFRACLLVMAALLAVVPSPLAVAEERQTQQTELWPAGPVGLGTGYTQAGGSQRVREVQRRLRRLGLRPGPIDGLFGPRTEAAVRRLQRGEGLEVDGVVGEQTLARLRARSRASRSGRSTQRGAPAGARRGARGDDPSGSSARPAPVAPDRPAPRPAPGTSSAPAVVDETDSNSGSVTLPIATALAAFVLLGLLATPPGRCRRRRPGPATTAVDLEELPPAPVRTGRFTRVPDPTPASGNGAVTSASSPASRTLTSLAPTAEERQAVRVGGGVSEHDARAADDAAPHGRSGVLESGTLADRRLASFDRVRSEIPRGLVAIEPEPQRDWSVGRVATGHRVLVALCIAVVVAALYQLQDLLWPNSRPPETPLEQIWGAGSLLWLGAVLPGALDLLGMLAYAHSRRLDAAKPIGKLVSFRIVSRGTNVEALVATIRRCQRELQRTPLFPYVIEVVTDTSFVGVLPPNADVAYITVPEHYRTPNGSLYKARALHFALTASEIPDDAWIVHLDEETQPTASGIKGICQMIREEEESGQLRIGQGGILYHRQWREHPFLTLADNVRTGDDFARFHFQHQLGVTVFGLHGSYIVVRNDVEKAIGFDFGPVGSITEDAFWALVAMERGHRCRWVDGYLEEQSTQSIDDFVRQRRRWFQGLLKVALHAPVKFRWRVCIGLNTLLWALAPFAALYTIGHLLYGFEVEPVVRLLANLSFASFATLYVVGLKANLDEHRVCNPLERAGWCMAQVVLLPLFTLIEGLGVLGAIFKPVAGFHVVKK